jgi:predicted molibdopterin-dependent oxidoreductase YjgC
MPDIHVTINGTGLSVLRGTTVAAAMLQAGVPCRVSLTCERRTALCGMGICFECRAVVDGVAQRPTCQILCADGMTVETQR